MSTGSSLHSSQTHTGFKTVSFSQPAYANEAAILPITRTGSLDERPQLAKGQAFTGSTVRNCGRNARKGPEGEDGEEAESVPSFVTHLITDDNRYSEDTEKRRDGGNFPGEFLQSHQKHGWKTRQPGISRGRCFSHGSNAP